jgi:hypothetical protein
VGVFVTRQKAKGQLLRFEKIRNKMKIVRLSAAMTIFLGFALAGSVARASDRLPVELNMRKTISGYFVRRFIFALVCCLSHTSLQHELRADPSPNSDPDAKALVDRMLVANAPWLAPSALTGSYSLLRTMAGETNGQIIGPWAFQDKAKHLPSNPTFIQVCRVGSLVWSPLHNMVYTSTNYSIHMVGPTNWNHMDLVAVDVNFDQRMFCQVAFGGQGDADFSAVGSDAQVNRILIEPTNAVPVFIQAKPDDAHVGQFGYSESTWQFQLPFFQVQGGFAPRSFEWDRSDILRERQEFQIVDQEWIFKHGEAWNGTNCPPVLGEPGALIQTFDMINVTLDKPLQLSIQRANANVILSWSSHGKSGLTLESTPGFDSPWVPMSVPPVEDLTNVVIVPATNVAQFFRLKR